MTESESNTRSERITLDELFSCLSDPTRRRVLTALTDRNSRDERGLEAITLKPDGTERRAFRTELHHRHLPRLEDDGFVEWDRDSGTVTRGPNFEQVRGVLALLDDNRAALPADWP